jgi:hypothetical protein
MTSWQVTVPGCNEKGVTAFFPIDNQGREPEKFAPRHRGGTILPSRNLGAAMVDARLRLIYHWRFGHRNP